MRDTSFATICPTEDGSQILPLHLHPQAAEIDLPESPAVRDVSIIFRTTYAEFRKLSPARVAKIFEKRHILITDCPLDGSWVWNSEYASLIAPLHQILPAQGQWLPTFIASSLVLTC